MSSQGNDAFTTGGNFMNLPWDEARKAIEFWLNEVVFQEPVLVDSLGEWKGYDGISKGLNIEFSRPVEEKEKETP